MPEQPGPEEFGFIEVPTQRAPFPLCHFVIASHLGITQYTEANAAECLRRARAFFALYDRIGRPLLTFGDDRPFTADDVTEDFIRHHLGQRVDLGGKTDEAFDEHLLNVEASLTGKPRISYRSITFLGHSRPDRPFRIVQEIQDQYRSESRRVEIYPDGTLLWREDGEMGTGPAEHEYTETEDVPGLVIINDRTNQRGDTITAEEFERLWERAVSNGCGWITDLLTPEVADALGTDRETYCTAGRAEDGQWPFCTEHLELARRMFPAVFVGA
ncbi:DUF6881 domain-containing protein [Streptomyces sp. NPDC001089]